MSCGINFLYGFNGQVVFAVREEDFSIGRATNTALFSGRKHFFGQTG